MKPFDLIKDENARAALEASQSTFCCCSYNNNIAATSEFIVHV
jgi:hypothetical protein